MFLFFSSSFWLGPLNSLTFCVKDTHKEYALLLGPMRHWQSKNLVFFRNKGKVNFSESLNSVFVFPFVLQVSSSFCRQDEVLCSWCGVGSTGT